jgi:hypothetical protein
VNYNTVMIPAQETIAYMYYLICATTSFSATHFTLLYRITSRTFSVLESVKSTTNTEIGQSIGN